MNYCLVRTKYGSVSHVNGFPKRIRFSPLLVACSRLRDSGEKSFSKKKCEKRPSYFRFARFNTSAPCYLRAWHRLRFSPLGTFRDEERNVRGKRPQRRRARRITDVFAGYCLRVFN